MKKLILGLFSPVLVLLLTQPIFGQLGSDEIIISEFFDDILRVNQGSVTDLFDIEIDDNISHLAVADSTTIFVANFTEVWRIDLSSGSVTTLVDLDGVAPSEITMGTDGNLLVSSASDGVRRVNVQTGAVSQVYDATFFNPSDITVSDTGAIYTTEFFDGLGVIGPQGGWRQLGDWETNFFSHVDLGSDGFLYAATTFEDGDIYKINPTSGAGQKIADNVYTFIDDLQVASDGTIYLAGAVDIDDDNLVEDLVMAINPLDGSWDIVVDETMVGNPSPPFFNPMDLDIYTGGIFYTVAVPEPSSGALCCFIGIAFVLRKRNRVR